MSFFEFPRWRTVRSIAGRSRGNVASLTAVTSEIQRLELRALLGGMPVISISDLIVPAEGNPGEVTQATFVVELSGTSGIDVTVSFITQSGTGSSTPSPSNGLQPDFSHVNGIVTIPAGETTANIQIPIVGDNQLEGNETFFVVLSDPSGATFSDDADSVTATGTITDDENPNESALSVGSPTIIEGNNRTQNVQVIVSVSPVSPTDITYSFLTTNGTAFDPSDYQGQDGTRTILAGQATDVINIPIVGDRSPEPNETFSVVIQSVTGGIVSNPAGTVTVLDSDGGRPTLTVGAGTATEGDAGTSSLNFPLTLSAASNFDIVITVSMRDGSANAGQDYVGSTITHTITAGLTSDSIAVPVVGDIVHEPDESFSMKVSAPRSSNVSIGSRRIIGTIADNDPVPTIIVQPSVVVSEADRVARFIVSLSNPTNERVTIDFDYISGTARQRRDFNARRGRLIFEPGQVQGSLAIPIVNDVAPEPTETFNYTITDAVNALIDELGNGGTVTINDNDHEDV